MTIDALTITSCNGASVSITGTPSPTTAGTPTIGANGLPTFGNLAFAVTGSGLVPSGPGTGIVYGLGPALAGTQIPGTPLGALRYVNPVVAVIGFSDPAGNISFGLGIPCVSSFSGLIVSAQLVDFDLALTSPIPIGTSAAATITVGN